MAIPSHDLLRFWRIATVGSVRSEQPDLTMRQMALMLIVYLTDAPHTVRGLAQKLDVAKPVITRALDSLGRMGLVRRKRDEADKRSVLVQRTMPGMAFLQDFEEILANSQTIANEEVSSLK